MTSVLLEASAASCLDSTVTLPGGSGAPGLQGVAAGRRRVSTPRVVRSDRCDVAVGSLVVGMKRAREGEGDEDRDGGEDMSDEEDVFVPRAEMTEGERQEAERMHQNAVRGAVRR